MFFSITKDSLWKPIRKATNVSLNHASVIGMIPVFNKHLDRLCKNIENYVDKGTFNIEDCLVKFGIEQVFGIKIIISAPFLKMHSYPMGFDRIRVLLQKLNKFM